MEWMVEQGSSALFFTQNDGDRKILKQRYNRKRDYKYTILRKSRIKHV